MSLTDNPDYDIVNGTKMMIFPETVLRKAIKKLEDKLKLYDMRLTVGGERLWLREHEKRNLLAEIFGTELTLSTDSEVKHGK